MSQIVRVLSYYLRKIYEKTHDRYEIGIRDFMTCWLVPTVLWLTTLILGMDSTIVRFSLISSFLKFKWTSRHCLPWWVSSSSVGSLLIIQYDSYWFISKGQTGFPLIFRYCSLGKLVCSFIWLTKMLVFEGKICMKIYLRAKPSLSISLSKSQIWLFEIERCISDWR